jgi:hypothetical protein
MFGTDSVIQTSDGGYALVGWTTSYGANANSYEGRAAWLVKTDANGNVEWNKTYNGDDFNAVVQTSDGGYVMAGASWNQTRSAFDLFVVKTGSQGNMQWSLTYIPDSSAGYLDWGDGYSLIQTANGGYIVAGSVRDPPDNPGTYWCSWVVKLTANGQVQWGRSYDLNDLDAGAHDIIQTTDGGYAFAGAALSYGGNGGKMWLVKIDANGNEQWNQTYLGRGGPTDGANSLVQTSDGGYTIAGYTYSSGTGYSDAILIKTDSSGNMIWKQTYGEAGENSGANSLIQTSDGGYLLAGYTNSSGAGTADVWAVKTDSLGNQEWNETFGGAGYSEATSVIQTSDGGYTLAGYSNSFGSGSYDFLLVKLASSSSTPSPSPSPIPSPTPSPTATPSPSPTPSPTPTSTPTPTPSPSPTPTYSLTVATSSASYVQGALVTITGTLTDSTTSTPGAGLLVGITVKDSLGNLGYETIVTTGTAGTYSTSFTDSLGTAQPTGIYTISAVASSNSGQVATASGTFTVTPVVTVSTAELSSSAQTLNGAGAPVTSFAPGATVKFSFGLETASGSGSVVWAITLLQGTTVFNIVNVPASISTTLSIETYSQLILAGAAAGTWTATIQVFASNGVTPLAVTTLTFTVT